MSHQEQKDISKKNRENGTEKADISPNPEISDSTVNTGEQEEQGQNPADIQQSYEELQEKYIRLYAEFDNYRKRTQREQLDIIRSASADLMKQILPVLDDFDRARQAEQFSDGVSMVYEKLQKILAAKGLRPMDTHHADFDAEFHEAITEIPAPDEKLKGKIVDTIEKGYYLNDKILRYAKVVVGK